jgi:hypothetical protein
MSAALTVSTQFYSVPKCAEIMMNGVSLEDLAFASVAKDARSTYINGGTNPTSLKGGPVLVLCSNYSQDSRLVFPRTTRGSAVLDELSRPQTGDETGR